tara:strand:- start:1957 stop:3204 length:1248 start_codon:yes stop_codon:yes gene_type:complete
MATTNIELDIENITGVADANDQFIISAQKFVVASIPKNLLKWASTLTNPSSHGGNASQGINIVMPTATDSILDVSRNGFSATESSYDMKGFIANSASLHLATNTYPKYYLDNAVDDKGAIVIVKPSPTDSATARVLYVDFTKIDDDCDLRNAVVYHATSSEFTKLASSKISDWSLKVSSSLPESPNFTTPAVASITVASTTLSNIGVPPTYVPPTVASDSTGVELSNVTQLDTENTIDDFDGNAIEFDQWWSTVTHLIEGEEDLELASATLQKISTYINAYSQSMQNRLNEFNDANVEYQAKLQESIQQAQINAQKAQQQSQLDSSESQQEASLLLQKENQEYAAKLQKFSTELNAYQADVNQEAQKLGSSTNNASFYSAESKKYYDWAQLEVSSYMKNNSKMISMAMANQATAQ